MKYERIFVERILKFQIHGTVNRMLVPPNEKIIATHYDERRQAWIFLMELKNDYEET